MTAESTRTTASGLGTPGIPSPSLSSYDPTRPTHPVTPDHRSPFLHLRCSKKTFHNHFDPFLPYDFDLSPLSGPPTGLLCDLLVQDTMLIQLCKPARGEFVPLPDLDKRVLDELLLT